MARDVASGHMLPFLLAEALRGTIDRLHGELAAQGHPGVRPVHGFALQAIGDGVSTVELGRRLGVSKQAAGKTVAGLEALGYARRVPDPADARVQRIGRTPRGEDCLRRSATILAAERARVAGQVGEDRLRAAEEVLLVLGGGPPGADLAGLPGWLVGT